MSASEYGSNYFCVMLEPAEENRAGDSVLLHADSIDIDASGTLKFTSLGRRPVGSDPRAPDKTKEAKSQDNGAEKAESKDGKGGKEGQQEGMIFMAFAPGTWRVVYAAKLQDGTPASVEHWNASNGSNGKPELAAIPARSGAEGFAQPRNGS
jgi:hypothetical protein